MAATVGTTIFFEDGPKNYIRLENGDQYLRQFYLPPNGWTILNLGILIQYEVSASAPNTGSGIWLGLCTSGQPGVGWKQATYNNYSAIKRLVGWGAGYGIGYIGTYGPSPQTFIGLNQDITGSSVVINGGYDFAVSASVVNQAGNVTPYYIPTPYGVPRKAIMCCSIRRGATITITPYWLSNYTGSDGSNHNHTFETLVSTINQGMAYNSTRTLDGISMFNQSGVAINLSPFDDASYPLDTINIYVTGSHAVRVYAVAASIVV